MRLAIASILAVSSTVVCGYAGAVQNLPLFIVGIVVIFIAIFLVEGEK